MTPAEAEPVVADNPERKRYEIALDGQLAGFTAYRDHGGTLTFTHTEVAEEFEGRGLGSQLVRRTLDDVRRRGLHIRPMCPFVRSFVADHHEYLDLVEPELRSTYGPPESGI